MKGWGGWQQVAPIKEFFFVNPVSFFVLKPESFPLFLSLSKMCVYTTSI